MFVAVVWKQHAYKMNKLQIYGNLKQQRYDQRKKRRIIRWLSVNDTLLKFELNKMNKKKTKHKSNDVNIFKTEKCFSFRGFT